MTITAFPGHTAYSLRSWWPLARWRALACICDMVGL